MTRLRHTLSSAQSITTNTIASDNNVLIRSGEARLVGWSRQMLYSGFNILPRSVFWSADFIGRSDNLDVIRLHGNLEIFDENDGMDSIR